ncbi:MAG: GNAT family N-acetyltransferase [Bacteroidota bacterium]
MSNITYRRAQQGDADRIAHLHIESWRIHYKDIWPAEFLAGPVEEDRISLWRSRMAENRLDRRVMLAESDGQLCGFACTVLNHDPAWGALLDNIHVSVDFQGKQIGSYLMKDAAKWILQQGPDSGLYLWVLEGNDGAIGYYEKMGGKRKDRKHDDIPTGGNSWVWRYHWEKVESLLER